ncbi:MAG: hypothetical protein OHK0047_33900 [Leptolyngbyaceae cyanobacterium]
MMSAESDVSATILVVWVGWVEVVAGDGDDGNPDDWEVGALQAAMNPVRLSVIMLSLSDRIIVESSMVSEVMGVLGVMKQEQSLLKISLKSPSQSSSQANARLGIATNIRRFRRVD